MSKYGILDIWFIASLPAIVGVHLAFIALILLMVPEHKRIAFLPFAELAMMAVMISFHADFILVLTFAPGQIAAFIAMSACIHARNDEKRKLTA